MLEEIAAEDGRCEEAFRHVSEKVALDDARRQQRSEEARDAIGDHLTKLRNDLTQVARSRQMTSLCAGSREDIGVVHIT